MKPSIPKGTRDFSPTEVANRTYITTIIKTAFENFGFQPIETPSFENSSTLMGKYGEEGDRLIFKILNSGDYLSGLMDRSYEVGDLSSDFIKFVEYIFINDLEEYWETISNGDVSIEFGIVEQSNIIKSFLNDRKDILIKMSKEYKLINDVLIKANYRNSVFVDFFKYFLDKELLNPKIATPKISEKALRYDLTVPFARYVVQHQNEITLPFKRYQIQPVWRADRPQKGRFREFYQCDADVVGSQSLWQEVEFIKLYDTVFTNLGLAGTTIKINNRKILSGIVEVIEAQDKLIDFTVALDKLDKIGKEGVVKEMLAKGISETAIEKLQPLFDFKGTNLDKLASLDSMLTTSEEGKRGVEELRFVINSITALGLQSANLEVDVTLARGLNYYTGAIFEVAAPKGVKMGSIGGGGRYDDLTGIFGLKNVSGVGISFGLDRIYLVLEELNLFKKVALPKPKVLFINFGISEALYCMKAITKLREYDIKSELFPDAAKMKKQMNYANKREIPFVVLVGSDEVEKEEFTVKNMISGEQETCTLSSLIDTLK